MDRADESPEQGNAGDRVRMVLLVLGHDRAQGPHTVDAGVGLVGGHDERDREDPREAHAEEEPAARILKAPPARAHGLRVLGLQIDGQVPTHGGNDGARSTGREWTRGWTSLPRRYYPCGSSG